MREQVSALLLGVDPAVLGEVHQLLTGLDTFTIPCSQGSFQDGPRLTREHEPDVAMIVMDGDARAAFALMEEITRAAPTTQIFALSRDDSTENLVKVMRAGATEFLSLPLQPAHVVKAFVKVTELRRLARPTATPGQIWTIYSPKGGAGVSTVAANLAFELHTGMAKSVCLVDLDYQSGDLALLLNVTPVYTLLDIALNFRRLDSVFLQGTLTRHGSGVYLLAAPPHASPDATPIPVEQVGAVLELLQSMYDVVIVDTSRTLVQETVAALSHASRVFLLVELTLPFLRGYRRTMEVLDAIGVPRERVEVVVAKHPGRRADIPLDEAKKSLDLAVTHLLPRDDDTAVTALNRGMPLAEVKANSSLRRAIVQIAATHTTSAGGKEEQPGAKKRKGLLGGIFSS
jgi:pilus assembly protein CpaE